MDEWFLRDKIRDDQSWAARRYYEEHTPTVDQAMRHFARQFLSGQTTEEIYVVD